MDTGTGPPPFPGAGDEGGDGPASPPPPDRPSRPWPLLALAGAAVVALLVLGGVLLFGDDDDVETSSTTSSSTPVPDSVAPRLDAGGQELVALLEDARDEEFHAVYDASSDDGKLTLEVWRKDGKVRQDTLVESSAGTARTQGFLLGDEAITCQKIEPRDWVCTTQKPAENSVDGVFGTAAKQLEGAEVTVSEETIGGRKVKCFAYNTSDGPGSMCVTDKGIPVKLQLSAATLTLTELEDNVDNDVFEPPAEPVQAPGS